MESIVALNIFLMYNYLEEGVLNMKIDKEKLFKRIKDEFTNSEIEVEKLKDVCVYDDSYISGLADEIIKKIDDRLLINLEEYINNQELSDIWIDKYCVNAVLKMRNGNGGIINAIIDLNNYAIAKDEKEKQQNENYLWDRYRKL